MATTSVRSLQGEDSSMLASYEMDPMMQVRGGLTHKHTVHYKFLLSKINTLNLGTFYHFLISKLRYSKRIGMPIS